MSDRCLELHLATSTTSSYNTLQLNIIMPGSTILALYPRKDGATFDKEYYLTKHMTIAMKIWGSRGLKSYTVSELNGDGPYSISTVMEFESPEALEKCLQDPNVKEIMDDVKNFSSEQVVLVHGNVIATS
ncbi:hypothetical protein ACET3X_006522 [Alternaria dauci]|uniref:EthD domain-containing protein n=1 Tax=Alternaria dauci TaxID=48095 RepID=A0ABR3UGK7_9PLEO